MSDTPWPTSIDVPDSARSTLVPTFAPGSADAPGTSFEIDDCQMSVDVDNRYASVGAIMVWSVDSAGTPQQLLGFARGTLIGGRVMLTAGHFTAPATWLHIIASV